MIERLHSKDMHVLFCRFYSQVSNMIVTERLSTDADGIARAAELLRRGELVAFPTETVYGLGADATSAKAVTGIYAAKERPRFNPLIAHVADLEAAQKEAVFSPLALKLAERFWPGPLTLVLPLAEGGSVADLARAGLDSVGLRVPSHPAAHRLLQSVGRPVAAPSANRSGRISPTQAAHVLNDLDGRIAAIVDGGATDVGVESTILMVRDDDIVLLRAGGVPRDAIEVVAGRELLSAHPHDAEKPLSPGMLSSHYAPRARVRLNADTIAPGEAVLLFGSHSPKGLENAATSVNLSAKGDLAEAAANLFSALHRLDASGSMVIAVSPVPDTGLGEAINDRLQRAAADRPG